MPSKRPERDRAQRKFSTKQVRGPKKSSGFPAERQPVQRKPFLDLCRQAGWTPQHLRQQVSSSQEFTQLLIKELVACREAGKLDLTLALCEAADAHGMRHSRIAANRQRAVRAQKLSNPQPDSSSDKKRLRRSKGTLAEKRKKGLWRRLSSAFSPKVIPGSDSKRRKTLRASSPSTASTAVLEKRASLLRREQQRESLKNVCLKSGWAPQCLQNESDGDLAMSCALEMQRCRQAGQHALVVALATEASVLGLDHPRIHENLKRSRAKAAKANVLNQAKNLLGATPPARQAAVILLADAVITEPDSSEYRKLLRKTIQEEINERSGNSLSPEVCDASIDLCVNERLLDALERRRNSVS